ncbi:hypothetical protein [Mesorhizobium australicum]|uniref:hypothetical protein n=1 Tax=Mesorhizobium australicum TaxID=536018 RepID=UPI00333A209E
MPNTHVPAAGEAMPAVEEMHIITGRFSRRAMLIGAIATISAAGAAVAAPAVSTVVDIHPDAELLRLDVEMEATLVRSDQLGHDLARIEEMAANAVGSRPLHPSAWESPPMPDDITAMRKALILKIVADGGGDITMPAPVREWQRATTEAKAQVMAAWEEYEKRCSRHQRLLGYDAKEAEDEECSASLWDIGQRIFAMPANTVEGLAVKLRASDRLGLDNFPDNEAFQSIAVDIRRQMEGGAS